MGTVQLKTALIVGAGAGLSASLARLFARSGMQVALAARRIDKLQELAGETAARLFQCDVADSASIVTLCARQGAAHRPESGRCGKGDRHYCVRWLHGRTTSRQAYGSKGTRRDFVHRRFSQRKGLSAVGAFCNGQVRLERARAEHGKGTSAAGYPCRTLRD